jgi:DNA invertase Pin-like site-specific DNA recombinase
MHCSSTPTPALKRLTDCLENQSHNRYSHNQEHHENVRQEAAMAIIGYARVSTIDQNPQLQLDALHNAGAIRIFTDHGVSGSTARRPELDACLDNLREDDVLTVWKLDRLGRNTQHVLAVVEQLTAGGIGFRSITEGLHTDGPMGKAMLTIMAAFAQLERDTMIERTRAGLVAAAANGRKGGRPRKVDDADAAKAHNLREKGINAADVAKMLNVSRATVYRYLAQPPVAAKAD